MDFAIFAIAFNIGKLYNKSKNTQKKQQKAPLCAEMLLILVFVRILYPKKAAGHQILPSFVATGRLM